MTESERQQLTGLYYADQLNQLINPNFGRLLALTASRDAAAAALDAAAAELATAVAAEPPIWSGGDPTPAVLIPMRLEVRYLSGASGPELAIRVVPDDIAVHTFEPELTADRGGRRDALLDGGVGWRRRCGGARGGVGDDPRQARRGEGGMDRRDDASDGTAGRRRAAAARCANEGAGVDEGGELPRAP